MIRAASTDRDEATRRIRKGLRQRSVKSWPVMGGRGTAWGWITIDAPPARRTNNGHMTGEERTELATLLGLDSVHHRGQEIPASAACRQEFMDRADGRVPSGLGQPHWD
jgi:hypothetical protein